MWLGMQKQNGNWYTPSKDDENLTALVNYTNWDSTKCTAKTCGDDNIGCPYMQTDRKWAFGMSKAVSSFLEPCTVCSFEDTPVFTIKGICSLDSQLDDNYYFVTNKTQQISAYDGFGTSKLIEKSGIWTFKDIGVSAEHSSEIPIG